MKRKFAVIGIVVSLMLAVGSCTKELGTVVDGPSSTINLTVGASLPDYNEVTKGSLVKNIRVCWTADDVVYVYDNAKCLGTLAAALENANDRYAVLSGTITSSTASKLTLVAAEGLAPNVKTKDESIASGVTFDLSSQNMDKDQAPYVVYAVIDNPSGTGVSDIKTSFSFATSVINVNCTALKEGTAVSEVRFKHMNKSLTITPKADAMPAITSNDKGYITRKGAEEVSLGTASAEGVLIFSVAVLDQESTTTRKIYVSQEGWPSSASFSAKALTKGTSYNTVCQLSGPYKTIGGHSGVRLWEDGPYWATCNIGAEAASDRGYYFMWGSTQAYEYRDLEGTGNDDFYKAGTNTKIADGGFVWTNYTEFGTYDQSDVTNYGFNKYNKNDNITQLEPIDDAATIFWGSGWRIPTKDDFVNLVEKCDWTWKGTAPVGRFVTGKNEYAGISIFIPAVGYGEENALKSDGVGYYWSSTLTYGVDTPYTLGFSSENIWPTVSQDRRYYGMNVRPVSD